MPPSPGLPVPRQLLIAFAVLALGFGLWQAVMGLFHLRASLAISDDPSHRELEQTAAVLSGGVWLLAWLHGFAALALARRPVTLNGGLLLLTGAAAALWVAAGLSGVAPLALPGVYPLGVALTLFIVYRIRGPGRLSVYLGLVIGAGTGCGMVIATTDALVCLAVMIPCIVYGAVGAAVAGLLRRD